MRLEVGGNDEGALRDKGMGHRAKSIERRKGRKEIKRLRLEANLRNCL